MAFIGSPAGFLIADNLVRITTKDGGPSTVGLTAGSTGTISLFEYTGGVPGVRLPEAFTPRDYRTPLPEPLVSLQDSIQLEITVVGLVAGVAVPVTVVKTGTTPQDFLITMTNTGNETVLFELYVRFH